jgi:DNA repair exonuclease SbcCD ATPase subunit
MTYRDRREARAEKLAEWADRREQAAASVLRERDKYRGDHAFNFQPGHIPERARLIAREDRAFRSLDKAGDMKSRASGIEDQLATSIYDDDPDAIEQLKARIERLEAERDAAKAANAAYLREHKAELAAMTPCQRGQAVPFPGYRFQNLSGNITRQRKRLAGLERVAQTAAALTAASVGGVAVRSGRGGWTEVRFDDKPSREIREGLKAHGFRWVKAGGFWAGTDAAYAASLVPEGSE